jgi:hypothetical protein
MINKESATAAAAVFLSVSKFIAAGSPQHVVAVYATALLAS